MQMWMIKVWILNDKILPQNKNILDCGWYSSFYNGFLFKIHQIVLFELLSSTSPPNYKFRPLPYKSAQNKKSICRREVRITFLEPRNICLSHEIKITKTLDGAGGQVLQVLKHFKWIHLFLPIKRFLLEKRAWSFRHPYPIPHRHQNRPRRRSENGPDTLGRLPAEPSASPW